MARFEFGKGKRKTYWDIEQFGRVLRTHESSGPSVMLPGFRMFADERSARAEFQQLVTERLMKGFVPGDDPARQIAAAIPKAASPAQKPPTLPLRRDVYVYNEATGFMVTSMSMAGVALDEGSKKWDKAVADGKMIPVILFQDDPFVVRVVAGDALTPQEDEEWVARIEWHLAVPDGKLAITGGAVLVNDEYDADDPYFESYLGTVALPPGNYRATIYTYVPSVNGRAVLDFLAGGYDKSEPPGKWFRRTRPGEAFPPWLRDWCVGYPGADPGHEQEWQSTQLPDRAEMPEHVDFLVHLEPAAGKAASGKPPIEDGWFGEAEGARQLERCPLGLVARDVIRQEKQRPGGWIYVHDILEKASRFAPVAIEGGPVELSPGELAGLYRLAWFSHAMSVPEICAALPPGGAGALPAQWPAQSLALLHEGRLRIGFSNSVRPVDLLPLLAEIGPFLAALPDATELELACSQLDDRTLQRDVPIGLHRYCVRVAGGKWCITESFPKIPAATLRAALALCAEVAAGDAIAVKDDAEGKAILKWADGNSRIWIEDNPGQIRDGRLSPGKRDPGVLALYGRATFAVRFGRTWPVLDLSGDDDEQPRKKADAAMPVPGAKILETPGGRIYFETVSLAVSEKLARSIQQDEPALKQLGFEHACDLVCNLFSRIAVRGYAQDGGDTWATFLVAAPETLLFEMSTRFEKDGASLLTTRKPGAKDDAAKHTYRQSAGDGDLGQMLARHEARKAELAARYGPPVKIARTVAALAASVEAALQKQLGG